MTKTLGLICVLAALLARPATAALEVGAAAPDFSTPATQGGNEFRYSLGDALKRGPVVLYFFPAAFTKGCTLEAHAFAEAIPKFQELGATVIGVSGDPVETLAKFSVSECQSKFPLASDRDQKIMTAYDAVLFGRTGYASRTSYVITPDGRVAYAYSAMNPDKHVENTLAALRAWRERK